MNSIKVSRKQLLFIAMGLLSLSQSFAQSQSLPLAVTGDDPYLPTETLPSGPHRGDPIPVEFRRSVQILNRDQANNTVTVANFDSTEWN